MAHVYTNRLAHEKSPYLLQHAHNPVEWFPWGDEAFLRAREEDLPIFLSIGYSTCHWCHVMERESFEDEAIADRLNAWFVPIKVDREERPDIDRLYMTAVQAMGIAGGWPLSVFLTPDLQPFYGGTYFPPVSRYGRAGFPDILEKIHELWVADRARITESAANITRFLRETPHAGGSVELPGPEAVELCYRQFRETYDPAFGGFGTGPKFPRPSVLHFLLRYGRGDSLEMVTTTLDRMASGGIYDHLGGGFHRYAVDGEWRVPHFEKMLYDQAQLAVAYLEAFQVTRAPLYASVVRATLGYVLRDLSHPEGGFYSAEDADSPRPEAPGERGEGAFYLWTRKEVMEELGNTVGELFCDAYGVQEEGNVSNDPHREFAGKNILYRPAGANVAGGRVPVDVLSTTLEDSRARLLLRRGARPRPLLDDKVLTAWNGLMISALALGARVLGEQRYETAARKAVSFVERLLVDRASGRLLRRFRDGDARFAGHLEDYAFLVQGLIDLYETSGDAALLRRAIDLTETQLRIFGDDEGGGLFDTAGDDGSLIVRMKEHHDGAEPSGNSVAAWNLLRLAELTDRHEWRDKARSVIEAESRLLASQPVTMPLMAAALGNLLASPHQIVILGPADQRETADLREEVYCRFLPAATIHCVEPGTGQQELSDLLPFAVTLTMIDGKPTAYVCRNFTCQLPTTDPDELGRQLDAI